MPFQPREGSPGPPASTSEFHTERALEADGPGVGNASRAIVVHDPSAESFRRLEDVLANGRLTPRWVSDGSALAKLRRSDDCGIALVAVRGEESSGSPALNAVALLKCRGYAVLCYTDGTATWALGSQCRLLLAGALDLLESTEPGFAATLRDRLEGLLSAQAERQREDRRVRQQMLDLGVVGSGPGITGVFRWVARVSPLSDLPALIVGETGTGKELVARAIHRLDPRRRHGPFLPVNCGAISAGLAESELFGHRRGAFTGAERDRQGHIRAARGGVLFLDEIGDLDHALQGKLLRVLQEHRVLALGEEQEVPVDVRIIAATNRNLEEMVRTHAFRADLFHRLNVLAVRIPALRERPEDIAPLVRHFIGRFVDHVRGSAVSATREFTQALQLVRLPGNVRQLENVVRRALINRKRGDQLHLSDLPPELWSEIAHVAECANHEAGPGGREASPAADPQTTRRIEEGFALLDPVGVLEASSWKLGPALDLCEQRIVAAALGASRGNRSRAARLLGISPRSIFTKMRKYRLTT